MLYMPSPPAERILTMPMLYYNSSPLTHIMATNKSTASFDTHAESSYSSSSRISKLFRRRRVDKAESSSAAYTLYFNSAQELVFEPVKGASDLPPTPPGYTADPVHESQSPVVSTAKVGLATDGELSIVLREPEGVRAEVRGRQLDLEVQTEGGYVYPLREGQGRDASLLIQMAEENFTWVTSAGLAMCVSLATRKVIAKLHYRVFGRDKLVISEDGLSIESLLMATAAKLWFEHEASKSFR